MQFRLELESFEHKIVRSQLKRYRKTQHSPGIREIGVRWALKVVKLEVETFSTLWCIRIQLVELRGRPV